ncbi:glycoside hydrolase family 61 protein [Pseudomassariella vexata]|uniref:lytic cellulose monooxygenase (C4-dehydrogenating) n=1 Tax=Pseudomassariella vexata TaxID=1141098 RepID=A0A1Y2DQ82_9PEZI|nr:glycoside hydrolase family 61 protein [Pseudomassariella vexata]ORY61448.1 glycoside hydrolase family 61 protein [Pseudomassariella vexata]
MKVSWLTALAFGLSAEAHCIIQKVTVNGADQGSLVGLRAPNDNNPVYDVSSSDIICQKQGSTSNKLINVAAGDKLGFWAQHVIGGAQFQGDADNPIAKSHKGPITVWLAKVDDAVSASKTGQKWFKVWEDTFNTGTKQWGVDNMIAQNGWINFQLPSCIASGQYLMRVEILALHSAKSPMGAQFYISCAQLQVTGSGSFSPSSTVSFPGAYQPNDPSIVINIYGLTGQPDNGGKAYNAPGNVPVIQC